MINKKLIYSNIKKCMLACIACMVFMLACFPLVTYAEEGTEYETEIQELNDEYINDELIETDAINIDNSELTSYNIANAPALRATNHYITPVLDSGPFTGSLYGTITLYGYYTGVTSYARDFYFLGDGSVSSRMVLTARTESVSITSLSAYDGFPCDTTSLSFSGVSVSDDDDVTLHLDVSACRLYIEYAGGICEPSAYSI